MTFELRVNKNFATQPSMDALRDEAMKAISLFHIATLPNGTKISEVGGITLSPASHIDLYLPDAHPETGRRIVSVELQGGHTTIVLRATVPTERYGYGDSRTSGEAMREVIVSTGSDNNITITNWNGTPEPPTTSVEMASRDVLNIIALAGRSIVDGSLEVTSCGEMV